jgi:uncharacterized protein (DUF488 family)
LKRLFTIGFTKKTAQYFFHLLKINNIESVIDIRLNNTSQLAGFAKYPDIQFFLNEICNIEYVHDKMFSPMQTTLNKYKKNIISWHDYVKEFEETMVERKIDYYIRHTYSDKENICLLCSEASADKCHRKLVANKFKMQFGEVEIFHIL